jgi:hypothetical protein
LSLHQADRLVRRLAHCQKKKFLQALRLQPSLRRNLLALLQRCLVPALALLWVDQSARQLVRL